MIFLLILLIACVVLAVVMAGKELRGYVLAIFTILFLMFGMVVVAGLLS